MLEALKFLSAKVLCTPVIYATTPVNPKNNPDIQQPNSGVVFDAFASYWYHSGAKKGTSHVA